MNGSCRQHIRAGVHAFLAIIVFALALPPFVVAIEEYRACKNVKVHDAPRNGLFCQAGKELGDIKAKTTITPIRQFHSFCGLIKRLDYFVIEYTLPNGQQVQGYVNENDVDGTPRFEPVKPSAGSKQCKPE